MDTKIVRNGKFNPKRVDRFTRQHMAFTPHTIQANCSTEKRYRCMVSLWAEVGSAD